MKPNYKINSIMLIQETEKETHLLILFIWTDESSLIWDQEMNLSEILIKADFQVST